MANKVFNLFLLLSALTILRATAQPRVFCYFSSWTIYRQGDGSHKAADVDPNLCSHILYAFVGIQDGHLWDMDPWESSADSGGYGLNEIAHLMDLKKINPDVKIILSMGGWNECESDKYSVAAATQRDQLNQDIINFIEERGFDGFDLDWEYPCQRSGRPEDKENFVTWLGELHQLLNARGKILSIAVSGGGNSVDLSYDVARVSANVDYLNIMSYDFHGAFDLYVGHYAPLFASSLDDTPDKASMNVAAGLQKWIDLGAEISKINIGIGTYGRSFTLTDPNNSSLYAPATAGNAGPYTETEGTIGYNEICVYHSDMPVIWDDEQQVPHKLQGNQWIGYDTAESVRLKIQYAKTLGINGAMIWSTDTDDFLNLCGDGKYPIISAVVNALNN